LITNKSLIVVRVITTEKQVTMKLLAVALAALQLLPSISLAQSAPALDGRLKKIHDTKSIAIAHRIDAAPFSFEEGKQVVGYSIDLCRRIVGALERQLGLTELKINWVPVTVQTRFDAVAKGQADMECGSSTVTLGRMKTVDFSSFTFVDGTGLLVKASLAANTLGDLGAKKIGVIGGTSNERALNEALKRRVINATVVPLKSSEEGLAQLEGGAIDAFASDRVLLMALAGKAKDPKGLALLGEALSFEPYAITLPRGDWQMRLAVNSALAQIYRSGAIGEIFHRWFGALGRPGAVTEATFLFGALPE
jgi:glutamate/aspartate transport system substrate-binding protein